MIAMIAMLRKCDKYEKLVDAEWRHHLFFVQLVSAIASQKVQKQNGTQLEHFCDDAKMLAMIIYDIPMSLFQPPIWKQPISTNLEYARLRKS